MNKVTSVQSFTYLCLVVSEKNVPNDNLTFWGYGLQSPLKRMMIEDYSFQRTQGSCLDVIESGFEKLGYENWMNKH